MAGHAGEHATARELLGHEEAKVRRAAFASLVRLGKVRASDIEAALADPSPAVRRSVCELAPKLPRTDFAQLLLDSDESVVEAACFAVGEQADTGAVEALMRIVAEHSDPLCRESAIAALGSIGDRRAVPALVAALDDRPQIRRRIVVALAAFEGPEVEAALERALEDHDWQVRQAAEDVTGRHSPG